jgi:hypothetical protein
MPSRLSIVAAVAATLIMIPALASAQGPVGAGPGPAGPGPAGPGGGGRGPGPAAAGPRVGGPGPGNVGRNVTVNRNVYINRGGPGGPVVGRRYHGGIWYGTGPRFWRGRWFAYGAGPCWAWSPIGYVWVCG